MVAASISGFDIAVLVATIAATALITRFLRPLITRVLAVLANRAVLGRRSGWRARVPRLFHESLETAELRRHQRISATATGLTRLLSTVAWTIAVIVVLERLDIDPVFALSGAGFLGVAISIGGQHAFNDFFTGITILLEDRFGEGDEVRIHILDEQLTAIVVGLGTFTTRFENSNGTYHVANRELHAVHNLSQRGVSTSVEVSTSLASLDRVGLEQQLRRRYLGDSDIDPAKDGLVLDHLERSGEICVAFIRTARELTDDQIANLGAE